MLGSSGEEGWIFHVSEQMRPEMHRANRRQTDSKVPRRLLHPSKLLPGFKVLLPGNGGSASGTAYVCVGRKCLGLPYPLPSLTCLLGTECVRGGDGWGALMRGSGRQEAEHLFPVADSTLPTEGSYSHLSVFAEGRLQEALGFKIPKGYYYIFDTLLDY